MPASCSAPEQRVSSCGPLGRAPLRSSSETPLAVRKSAEDLLAKSGSFEERQLGKRLVSLWEAATELQITHL